MSLQVSWCKSRIFYNQVVHVSFALDIRGGLEHAYILKWDIVFGLFVRCTWDEVILCCF